MESREPFQLNLPLERRALVLIVEDDHDTQTVLSHFLSINEYDVLCAGTGREALTIIENEPNLDIILLDVFVPGIGGIEVLSRAKRFDPYLNIIMMTALGDREIAHRALELGAFDCLLKPLDLTQLEATLIASLSHSEYRKQSWWKRLILDPAA